MGVTEVDTVNGGSPQGNMGTKEEERGLLCRALQNTGALERGGLNLEAFAKILVKKTRRGRGSEASPRSPPTPVSPSSSASLDAVIEDILSYTAETSIPTSMVKYASSDVTNRAIRMFQSVTKFCASAGLQNGASAADKEAAATHLNKVLKDVTKRPEMVDEAYMQALKQATNCGAGDEYESRAWELILYLCATAPPRNAISNAVTAYIHDVVHGGKRDGVKSGAAKNAAVYETAAAAFAALKKTKKRGARANIPLVEELEALTAPQQSKPTVIVFFLDETFEELYYDASTSVADAVEQIATKIGLRNFETFRVFECYRLRDNGKGFLSNGEVVNEYRTPDENTYICDMLQNMRTATVQNQKDLVQCTLVFKKLMFREKDEEVDEPVFVNLSYVQAQNDYKLGAYPVKKDEAITLAAFQIFSDFQISVTSAGIEQTLLGMMNEFFPRELRSTMDMNEAVREVALRLRAVANMSKEETRAEFLRILCHLPYGNSSFYNVKRIEDPIGLLPSKVIIGVNKRGIHFFRPVPKEYLHTAELRDIMQFGSNSSAVFFKMRVSGTLHIFQFETKQGEEVCQALQTHISDIMSKRSRPQAQQPPARPPVAMASSNGNDESGGATAAGGATSESMNAAPMVNGGVHTSSSSSSSLEMRHALDAAQAKIDALTSQKAAAEDACEKLRNELEDTKELLESKSGDGKSGGSGGADDVLLAKRLEAMEKRAIVAEESMASLVGAQAEGGSKMEAQMRQLGEDKAKLTESIVSLEARGQELEQEKKATEKKLARLEKKLASSSKDAAAKHEAEVAELRGSLAREQARAAEVSDELSQTVRSYEEQQEQMKVELDELRELHEEQERKDKKTSEIILQQKQRVDELEKLYKEEVSLRKKYFNMMEDMKGKIRVYCRVRPMTPREEKAKQNKVVSVTDEFSIQHPWKDERKPRSYEFDTCFSPQSTQEDVFHDTRYLIQSAVDGYNVCVFAYGQTGSGKTFTITGNKENPGLVPRGVEELFDIIQRDSSKYVFKLSTYMMELYCDNLKDLLAPVSRSGTKSPPLNIKKDSKGWVTVQNITEIDLDVSSPDELNKVIEEGMKRRKVSGTQMNIESSRSHLIIGIVIESTNLQTQAVVKGKLSFVDLAGSERLKKSGSEGEQMKEAQAINKSLSALADVISALATEQAHVPYRNHKLTMLMSDSLGGNAKTLMFVNASPTDSNVEETQNSLQYATRVRSITNDIYKNLATKEVAKLKKSVEMWKARAGNPGPELFDIQESRDHTLKDSDPRRSGV